MLCLICLVNTAEVLSHPGHVVNGASRYSFELLRVEGPVSIWSHATLGKQSADFCMEITPYATVVMVGLGATMLQALPAH